MAHVCPAHPEVPTYPPLADTWADVRHAIVWALVGLSIGLGILLLTNAVETTVFVASGLGISLAGIYFVAAYAESRPGPKRDQSTGEKEGGSPQ